MILLIELDALVDHQKWAQSRGTSGTRACFSTRDLRHCVFRAGELTHANFTQANLTGADFSNSKLDGCIFQGACLERVNFSGCSLRDCDFTGATGLNITQLEGADLQGALLPTSVADYPIQEFTARLAEECGKWFSALLLLSGYSLLTMVSTKDPALILNSVSAILPGISTPIATMIFYLGGPWVLLVVQGALLSALSEFHCQWRALPAVLPNGAHRGQLLPAFLAAALAPIAPAHPLPTKRKAPPDNLRVAVTLLAMCLLAPAMVTLLWWNFLPRQSVLGTVTQVVAQMLSYSLGWQIYVAARGLPDGGCWRTLGSQIIAHPWKTWVSGGVIALAASAALFLGGCDATRASLNRAVLSTRPDKWEEANPNFTTVTGAKLTGRNLVRARMSEVFLVRAELDWVDARQADLGGADLRRATLKSANLNLADLREAKLDGSDFSRARLIGVQAHALSAIKLSESMPVHGEAADFTRANLSDAHFNGAILTGAVFQEATAPQAQFVGAQMEGVQAQGGKTSFSHANFKDANLLDADFSGADLHEATFEKAKLHNTRFVGSDLRGVDLTVAEGLNSKSQIDGAKMDAQTKIPANLH